VGALRRQPRFFGLRPVVCFVVARIIYALITVINNSGVKNRVGAGAKPPRAKPEEACRAAQRPAQRPPANARMRHNRHQTSYEIMRILKK